MRLLLAILTISLISCGSCASKKELPFAADERAYIIEHGKIMGDEGEITLNKLEGWIILSPKNVLNRFECLSSCQDLTDGPNVDVKPGKHL